MDTNRHGYIGVDQRVWTICTYPLRTIRGGQNHHFVAAEVTRLKSHRTPKSGQSLLTSAATMRWRNARRELENKSGRKVVTSENCLALTQAAKKAKRVK